MPRQYLLLKLVDLFTSFDRFEYTFLTRAYLYFGPGRSFQMSFFAFAGCVQFLVKLFLGTGPDEIRNIVSHIGQSMFYFLSKLFLLLELKGLTINYHILKDFGFFLHWLIFFADDTSKAGSGKFVPR